MNKQTPQQRQYERRKGQPKITGLYISHEEKALLDAAVAISGGIKAAIFDGLKLVVADQEKIATWISVNDRLPEFTSSFGGFALVSDDVVACSASKGNVFADYSDHGWTSEDGDILDDVIKWLPLPPPPESTK